MKIMERNVVDATSPTSSLSMKSDAQVSTSAGERVEPGNLSLIADQSPKGKSFRVKVNLLSLSGITGTEQEKQEPASPAPSPPRPSSGFRKLRRSGGTTNYSPSIPTIPEPSQEDSTAEESDPPPPVTAFAEFILNGKPTPAKIKGAPKSEGRFAVQRLDRVPSRPLTDRNSGSKKAKSRHVASWGDGLGGKKFQGSLVIDATGHFEGNGKNVSPSAVYLSVFLKSEDGIDSFHAKEDRNDKPSPDGDDDNEANALKSSSDEPALSPEFVNVQVGVMRGEEKISLGVATFVVSGEEMSARHIDLPVRSVEQKSTPTATPGVEAQRTPLPSKKFFSKKKRGFLKRFGTSPNNSVLPPLAPPADEVEASPFLFSRDNRLYGIEPNATLRVCVDVVDMATIKEMASRLQPQSADQSPQVMSIPTFFSPQSQLMSLGSTDLMSHIEDPPVTSPTSGSVPSRTLSPPPLSTSPPPPPTMSDDESSIVSESPLELHITVCDIASLDPHLAGLGENVPLGIDPCAHESIEVMEGNAGYITVIPSPAAATPKPSDALSEDMTTDFAIKSVQMPQSFSGMNEKQSVPMTTASTSVAGSVLEKVSTGLCGTHSPPGPGYGGTFSFDTTLPEVTETSKKSSSKASRPLRSTRNEEVTPYAKLDDGGTAGSSTKKSTNGSLFTKSASNQDQNTDNQDDEKYGESNTREDPDDDENDDYSEENDDRGEENTLDENTLDENTLDENTLDENTLDENTLDENTLDENTLDENTLDDASEGSGNISESVGSETLESLNVAKKTLRRYADRVGVNVEELIEHDSIVAGGTKGEEDNTSTTSESGEDGSETLEETLKSETYDSGTMESGTMGSDTYESGTLGSATFDESIHEIVKENVSVKKSSGFRGFLGVGSGK